KMLKDAKLSRIFYVGVAICGMILPIVASVVAIAGTVNSGLLIAGSVGVIIGDLSMRYLLMRCGYYTPLLPETPY
ncbi:MAG: polysulfide reductase NrfD, partial [Chloroflexi bacterium]|nr:polysulfide reductase NrfD [Chloroflexota bacterium]